MNKSIYEQNDIVEISKKYNKMIFNQHPIKSIMFKTIYFIKGIKGKLFNKNDYKHRMSSYQEGLKNADSKSQEGLKNADGTSLIDNLVIIRELDDKIIHDPAIEHLTELSRNEESMITPIEDNLKENKQYLNDQLLQQLQIIHDNPAFGMDDVRAIEKINQELIVIGINLSDVRTKSTIKENKI